MYEAIVVGTGFTGSITARFLAENKNKKTLILEKRNHIAGNMYDLKDDNGILYQKYGPHAFHTNNKKVMDYLSSFGEWTDYRLECMVYMNGKFTPSPFNFQTVDDYYDPHKSREIKSKIKEIYKDAPKASIVDMLESKEPLIKEYADFLFKYDYSLYTAKQWGIKPSEIDVSVLKRVPVLFSYKTGYFDDIYQALPVGGFTKLFEEILNHKNITVRLNEDAKKYLAVDISNKKVLFNNEEINIPVIYTGAADELLDYTFGLLPYRSLYFKYKNENINSYQKAPIVAYPQEERYTRITEYTKLPYQKNIYTKIAFEYPLSYKKGDETEPYYPIINDSNINQYMRYADAVKDIKNLFLCGRLADYKYYNMDQAIERAFEICSILEGVV